VAGPADLAVVICTFHREKLLAELLMSLSRQKLPDGLNLEVVIVDNSDEGSAAEVIASAATQAPFPLTGLVAHPPNISVARNAGVAATQAPFIVFLDDDQKLDEAWLAAIAAALRQDGVDAWFGRVLPRFEAQEPLSPMTRRLFSRDLAAPAGTRLIALGPGKNKDISLATNNSIFRRSAIPQDEAPFDTAFGNGGGEDYDLICRMERNGSRFVWMPDAVAYEVVPAQRCAPDYLTARFFAGGQAFALAAARASAHPRRTRWILRLKALVQAGLHLARWPLVLRRSAGERLDYRYTWAGIAGKLSFGDIRPIYREAGRAAGKN